MDDNLFQGIIPSTLNLNLSFNDFEGAVLTKGTFANTSAISVMGNKKLCGGIPELQLSPCKSNWFRKRRLTLTLELAVAVCSGLVGLTFLLCMLYIYWYRKIDKDFSSFPLQTTLLKVSYQTLLKAIEGFSSANFIGAGSFGSVYKGLLENDGSIVAVKVVNLQRHGASKSFIAECEALRNIKHRNLVKVLTTCSGVDYQGNDFKALVYDFMENGSLEKWLHPVEGLDLLHNEPKKLDLHQ
ncbi:unnamed protein product [Camellia sinensis]